MVIFVLSIQKKTKKTYNASQFIYIYLLFFFSKNCNYATTSERMAKEHADDNHGHVVIKQLVIITPITRTPLAAATVGNVNTVDDNDADNDDDNNDNNTANNDNNSVADSGDALSRNIQRLLDLTNASVAAGSPERENVRTNNEYSTCIEAKNFNVRSHLFAEHAVFSCAMVHWLGRS